MQEIRDTHLAKICDICGDVGFKDLIMTCSQCSTIGRHAYCMRVVVMNVDENWVCEECVSKIGLESPQLDQKEEVLGSTRNVSFNVGRQVACKRQKTVETSKVKFLSTEEAIKLSSGLSKKQVHIRGNLKAKPPQANFIASPSKRTSLGSNTVNSYFKPERLRPSPSFLPQGYVKPPRVDAVQTSSPAIQHAINTPKESKEEKAPQTHANKCNTNKECALSASKASMPDLCIINNAGQSSHDAAATENFDVEDRETWNIRLKISLYRPHLPALYISWKGGFILDIDNPGEFYGGFQARPPCRVHRKAYNVLKKIPPVLKVNLLDLCELQKDLLQNGCLDLRDIALYISPVCIKRFQGNYNTLFQLMDTKKSVMTSNIDGVELLIFTSKQLHVDVDLFKGSNMDFFCGVFRRAKDNLMRVSQKLPPLVSPSEYTHDNADMDSGEAGNMEVNMVGGKVVGIPNTVVSKESEQDCSECALKENLDAINNGKNPTILDSVVQPVSLEHKQEYCNDSDLPSKSTENIKSEFTVKSHEHQLGSIFGRLPCSASEIVIPRFEGTFKLNSSSNAPRASNAEEKKILDERRITSQVKEEFGCQDVLQVASGVSGPQSQQSIQESSSLGSQKQRQVLAHPPPPSAACAPSSFSAKGTEVGAVIKPEGNDNEKPLETREKKGPPVSASLSKDRSQITATSLSGSSAVEMGAKIKEVTNDSSALSPLPLLDLKPQFGVQIKAEGHDNEKPMETHRKRSSQGSSFLGEGKSKKVSGLSTDPCAGQVKAEPKFESDRQGTSLGVHSPLACSTETSSCSRSLASTSVKLSVAGWSMKNLGTASAGGLICNESGKWVVGYNLKLGNCTSLAADFWALLQGMKLAWDRGYRKVVVRSDSIAAVDCLKVGPSPLDPNRALIQSCIDAVKRKWDCVVCPIKREENLCANWLASHAEGSPLVTSIVVDPPAKLIPLLEVHSKLVEKLNGSSICSQVP